MVWSFIHYVLTCSIEATLRYITEVGHTLAAVFTSDILFLCLKKLILVIVQFLRYDVKLSESKYNFTNLLRA